MPTAPSCRDWWSLGSLRGASSRSTRNFPETARVGGSAIKCGRGRSRRPRQSLGPTSPTYTPCSSIPPETQFSRRRPSGLLFRQCRPVLLPGDQALGERWTENAGPGGGRDAAPAVGVTRVLDPKFQGRRIRRRALAQLAAAGIAPLPVGAIAVPAGVDDVPGRPVQGSLDPFRVPPGLGRADEVGDVHGKAAYAGHARRT